MSPAVKAQCLQRAREGDDSGSYSSNKKNRGSLTVDHMMSGFAPSSINIQTTIQTLTLGATVADRGYLLQRDFSLWIFRQSPPG